MRVELSVLVEVLVEFLAEAFVCPDQESQSFQNSFFSILLLKPKFPLLQHFVQGLDILHVLEASTESTLAHTLPVKLASRHIHTHSFDNPEVS